MIIRRKLKKYGNDWVLDIDDTIINLLNINPEIDILKYSLMGNKIYITKIDEKKELN